MSNRCLRPLAVFVAIVFLGIPCRSQSTEGSAIARGELRSDVPLPFRDYWVELSDANHFGDTRRADVQSDGSFQVRDIRSGVYTLRVTTVAGELVHQETVNVNPQAGPMTVHLPGAAGKPSAPGTISMTQLQHPPARKALQAAVAAQRFASAGNTQKAVEELEKAIRISPEYADAYNNLAVENMRIGRFPEAAGELDRALAIAGPNAMLLTNLAFAQCRLNLIPEATVSARAALRLDSGSAQAHLILGWILARDPRTRAEGIRHLERASETLPSARVKLEELRR